METAVPGLFSFRPAAHFDDIGLIPLEELLDPQEQSSWAFVPNLGEAVDDRGRIAAIGSNAETNQSGVVILIPPHPADLNGDGVVGVEDLLQLLAAWGPCADPGDCPEDLDGDGQVGVTDFLILLGDWG